MKICNQLKLKKWQVLLIGFALLHMLLHILVMPALNDIPKFWFEATYFLVTVVFIALPVFVLAKNRIRFQSVDHSLITPAFFIFGCIMLKAWFSQYFYQQVLPQDFVGGTVQPGAYPDFAFDDAYTLFDTLVTAPLVEETIYRLGLLGALAIALGRFPALLISSAVFAIGHLGRVDSVTLAPYFVYGLLLGLTYLLYGSLWVVFAHFLFNFQAYLNSKGYLEMVLASPFATIILGLLAISGLFIFFQQIFKNRRGFGNFFSR